MQPEKNDNFSKYICHTCWNHINNFHTFYNNVELIYKQLNTTQQFVSVNIPIDIKAEILNEIDFDNDQKYEQKIDFIDMFNETEVISNKIESDTHHESDMLNDLSLSTSPPPATANKLLKSSKKSYRKKKIIKQIDDSIDIEIRNKKIQKRSEEDEKIRNFYNLKCDVCGHVSLTFIQLRAHYRIQHNIRRGYVKCCNRKMVHRGALQEHILWHLNPDTFKYIHAN